MFLELLILWKLFEDDKPPTRAHRYRSTQEQIDRNVEENRIQRERDERARQEANGNRRNLSS